MARPAAKELTERELEIMHIFWNGGEATVQEVRDALAATGRDCAYTTVATLVRILHDKKFLEQTNEQRPFRFRAARLMKKSRARCCATLLTVYSAARASNYWYGWSNKSGSPLKSEPCWNGFSRSKNHERLGRRSDLGYRASDRDSSVRDCRLRAPARPRSGRPIAGHRGRALRYRAGIDPGDLTLATLGIAVTSRRPR